MIACRLCGEPARLLGFVRFAERTPVVVVCLDCHQLARDVESSIYN
jgi:hypothetical protein